MSRARILIVDDLPEKLLVYSSLLEDVDAEIVQAHSGTEALKRVLEGSFAVILLDVNMPDIDGLETATLIRGHRNGRQTPIIFITAYADEMQTARGYALGAVDYIQSPVVAPVLRSKVQVFVDLFKAHAALALSNQELENRVKERTAELEQLSRLKDEFLATMSHELRTPLNAIFGWVTLLRTRRLDEPTQERALETIERNARAQKRLIEDLLDVSRIVTGKVALEILPVNPAAGGRSRLGDHAAGGADERASPWCRCWIPGWPLFGVISPVCSRLSVICSQMPSSSRHLAAASR